MKRIVDNNAMPGDKRINELIDEAAKTIRRRTVNERIFPDGPLHVLPPCGHCREFMLDIDEGDLEIAVLPGRGKAVTLRDLLPYHEWPEPLPPST